MSHLSNSLATARQLYSRISGDSLPTEPQDSVRYYAARLTQAAAILLRLPQAIAAQAVVILFRYWLVGDMMKYEFSDVSAASIWLIAKISSSPRSLRSITNVYACLLSTNSPLSSVPEDDSKHDPETYYLPESHYITFRNRILDIEGQILNGVGFDMHISLPHPLAVTYLQALDVFSSSQLKETGHLVAKRAIEYLNTALVSPQMLYLTHQPNALATAAIYLAARDVGAKLPDHEWWEVFDADREDLGFLALSMRSLEGWVKAEVMNWGTRAMITRSDIREVLSKKGNGANHGTEDEEAEMMRMMDEKVG